jgi:CheY-like chemotaxis protein
VSTSVSLNIVIAEDNPHDVLFVRMALQDAGLDCDLRVLKDGDQAIQFIESTDRDRNQPPIDLLLLDLSLPKRDGEEILKRLRATERIAQTPVIVMTGSDAPQGYESAQKNAAVEYFRKPSDFAKYMRLGVIVRDLLSARTSASGAASTPLLKREAE